MSTQTEQPVVSRWQRTLLPGDFLQTSDVRRSARDWLVDAFLFVLAIAIGVLGLVDTWHDHNAVAAGLDIALGAIAILALWWRREHPLAVALLTVSFSVFAAMAGGAAIIAVFNVALRGSRRALVGIAALALFTLAIFPILYPGSGYVEEVVFGVLILVIAIGWGLFARVRRELVLSLRERAERLETEQQWHVEQAREAERRRIAREMHDVLAHRLSLLSVHAGALEFRPDAPPEEVAEAAGVIRETAQTALQELRDVIGVLRDDAEDSSEPPQPTLSEIPALVEESRAAGMRVETRIELPDDGTLPAALGRTAYRIVQEGLTNARKHAPAAAVEVSVSEEQGPQLVVEVVSRRAVGVAAVAAARGGLSGAGTGLVGLAERVALAGGELSYGPDEKGDFVLRAVLPWSP